jgi:SNF family Na+-dependent transporter
MKMHKITRNFNYDSPTGAKVNSSSTGAFLIPFMIMLVLEGIPLFLIELGMGQRMRLGSLGVWNTIHPWLGGIGISSCVVTLFVAIYYNVIITWCIFYFVNSFRVSLSTIIFKFQIKNPHIYYF